MHSLSVLKQRNKEAFERFERVSKELEDLRAYRGTNAVVEHSLAYIKEQIESIAADLDTHREKMETIYAPSNNVPAWNLGHFESAPSPLRPRHRARESTDGLITYEFTTQSISTVNRVWLTLASWTPNTVDPLDPNWDILKEPGPIYKLQLTDEQLKTGAKLYRLRFMVTEGMIHEIVKHLEDIPSKGGITAKRFRVISDESVPGGNRQP